MHAVGSPALRRRRTSWTDDLLEAALREYIGERRDFPTHGELERTNRTDLQCAIKNRGGQGVWMERLGLERRPGQDRSPYGPADALRDAREVIAQEGYLPGLDHIRAAGWPRLASHIKLRHRNTSLFLAARGHELA